jgi:hypothetical protein
MITTLVKLGIIRKVSSHANGIKSASYSLSAKTPVWDSITALQKYSSIPSKIIARRNALRGNLSNDLKTYKKYTNNITLDIPPGYFTTDNSGEKVGKKFIHTYTTTSISFSSPSYSSSSTPVVPHGREFSLQLSTSKKYRRFDETILYHKNS